jgi:hypothetical protein
MMSKTILALAAAAAFLPATAAMVAPAHAQQRGYVETYVDRDRSEYGQYRRGSSYQRGPGTSSGVGVGSDACSDPSYRQDPRCYSNR